MNFAATVIIIMPQRSVLGNNNQVARSCVCGGEGARASWNTAAGT